MHESARAHAAGRYLGITFSYYSVKDSYLNKAALFEQQQLPDLENNRITFSGAALYTRKGPHDLNKVINVAYLAFELMAGTEIWSVTQFQRKIVIIDMASFRTVS